MRIFAAFIAESQTDFIDGFFVGKKISDMKDNRGNKMKDYILRQRLAEYDAKLDLVYRNFSEYVHLAEKAFYSSVTTSSSEQYVIKSGSAYRKEKWRTKNMHSGVFFSDLASSEKSTKWSGRFCLKILLGPLHLRMGKISKFK